jgi:hypothetical protein
MSPASYGLHWPAADLWLTTANFEKFPKMLYENVFSGYQERGDD